MDYGRGFRRNRQTAGDYLPHDPAIDYGYRRGGFMGSGMGRNDRSFGPGGVAAAGGRSRGGRPGWSGSTGRFGGGGPWNAYGSDVMDARLGRLGRGGPRRGMGPARGMRYDVGYGMGNDREWY
ncbi:MAG TPA: hypothetical protein VFL93_10325 [Longimicrobiaceae bacterium]|nr:hypothetical protein [Longimicrobiaceae bacterium]